MVEITSPDLDNRSVLLVTHPTPHVLESLILLVERELLKVPALTLVGVFHLREWRGYDSSRKLLVKKADPRFRLFPLDCAITEPEVFRTNDCTAVFDTLVQESSGIIFTGGADLPPSLYGEETAPTTIIETPLRQWWEVSLLAHLLGTTRNPKLEARLASRPDYPVTGICMGMQAMNVAAGGTMVQDIPTDLYGVKSLEEAREQPPETWHRNPHRALYPAKEVWYGAYHPIKFTGAPELWKQLAPDGEPVDVMSIHHQAVDDIAPGLEVIATSLDGRVPEALRHQKYPNVLGIQFHPEYKVIWDERMALQLTPAGEPPAGDNEFAAALAADPRDLAFHRGFWKLVADRLQPTRVTER